MVSSRNLLILLTLSALCGCVSPGSIYAPANANLSSSVGYRDSQLSTGAYQVTFTAPESAGMSGAQNFAMLRAAELTVSKGHAWFQLISTNTKKVEVERQRQTFQQTTANMTCNTGMGAGGMGCTYSNLQDNSIAGVQMGSAGAYQTRLVTTLVFIMGDGAKPAGDHVYDAKETVERLRASVNQ